MPGVVQRRSKVRPRAPSPVKRYSLSTTGVWRWPAAALAVSAVASPTGMATGALVLAPSTCPAPSSDPERAVGSRPNVVPVSMTWLIPSSSSSALARPLPGPVVTAVRDFSQTPKTIPAPRACQDSKPQYVGGTFGSVATRCWGLTARRGGRSWRLWTSSWTLRGRPVDPHHIERMCGICQVWTRGSGRGAAPGGLARPAHESADQALRRLGRDGLHGRTTRWAAGRPI